ncbi:MAG: ADP-ribosyl-[dinitrogen reductase] hydrolase [Gammaproteobacteria bacterium]|nr:ADP-ribosyl-[dinitrogen reductase] hydrolase [Gammaproteobacteria bacterium]
MKDTLWHKDESCLVEALKVSPCLVTRPAPLVFDHARAAYLGLAIGDALGATTEFMTPGEIKAKHKLHRKIIGGGWLYLKPGQVTDDTEMSLALGKALLLAGQWDLKGIAENFLAWMKSKPVDIGATCRRGIRDYMLKGQLEVPYNEWDAGNGAAMRMAPVALFTLGDFLLLEEYAIKQAHLTHNHILSDAACVVIGCMVQQGILGTDRHNLHETTRELVAEHPSFRFNNYRGNASPYVVDTLQTVFHYLFSTANFEECLIGVVNQGGDADTTGAIAGMIAGAFYGLDAIPARWLKKLNKEVKDEAENQTVRLVKLSPWGIQHA